MKILLVFLILFISNTNAEDSNLNTAITKYNINCKDLYGEIRDLFFIASTDLNKLSPTNTPSSLNNFIHELNTLNSRTNFCPTKTVSINRDYFFKATSDTSLLIVLLKSFMEKSENSTFLIKKAKTTYNNLFEMYEHLSLNYIADSPLNHMPNKAVKRD